jgi:O-antigen/teichoic acid export membrane protein
MMYLYILLIEGNFTMKDGLFKKFLSFSYGSWIGLIIGFLGTIITTRILLPEDFGRASMFTLVLNISMIFISFGTDQAFVRFFYEEKEEKRGGLLYNCLKIPFLVSVLVSLIILIFNKKIALFLFEEENLTALIMLIVGILSQVLFRYGSLVVRMQQKGNLFSIMEIINRSLSVLVLIILYYIMGPNYEIVIYSSVINLLFLAIFSIVNEKSYWNLKNLFVKDLFHTQRNVFNFGYPILFTMLLTWLFQSFDRIAIKQWSTYEELGLYAAAFKIIALVSILQVAFTTFWTPVCYEHFQKEPNNKGFYEKISKIIAFSMFFVAVLSIAGKDVIVFLLGKNYSEAANIMPFLVFMPIMYTISETTVIGINFFKKPQWHILIAGAACLINILGNWLLVPSYGAVGASISTAFAYIVFFLLRTHLSLLYYKVNYGLKNIYFMLVILTAYALYSISTTSFYLNILAGLGVLLILVFLYKNDIMYYLHILKRRKLSANEN